MSLQDPISDMICRIRNAQQRSRAEVSMPHSKLKADIAEILKREGYILACRTEEDGNKKTLIVELKYFEGKPVIEFLERVSKPSVRRYKSKDELPRVIGGLGAAIVSTSRGVMTDKSARAQGIGGEVLCIVA